MSSQGYGVFRNTFAAGKYDFGNSTPIVKTVHQEQRFDAYYFVGAYKQALDGYTKLTGRPMMPPVYALEYGDADCYNRSNPSYKPSGFTSSTPKQNTYDAVQTAAEFKAQDMPGAWMLVNDGYGCEYTPDPEPYDPAAPGKGLSGTVQAIREVADLRTGLWTERSLTAQEREVGRSGIALRKLDVAWVGEGYRMALTACESAYGGIERYSDRRGVSLMVEGWAGSQRCGIQWTGDHAGTLSSIRWQVPALAGSGNSGLAFTTADVDGIFGGSTESYVRDLQWKAFAPALYSMSGWVPKDKRPWLYGEAATEINRKYLQLRQQLMPYIYSLAAESHRTGTPMMRTMALEFPDDPASYGAEANNQFMLGSDYLVAPVSASTDIRNGIVLPAGSQWVDYWSGRIYQGGQVINGYQAPLQTLPLFVRAGAVVPSGIIARNASLVPEDSALTLNIYPQGDSSFELYEDAKVDRSYQQGQRSLQRFTVSAPQQDAGDITVRLGAREGGYAGMAASRPYELAVYAGSRPESVMRDGQQLPVFADRAAFNDAAAGWFYDDTQAGGVVRVKAGVLERDASAEILLKDSSAVGGKDSDATAAQLSLDLAAQVFQGVQTTASVTFRNTGSKAKEGATVRIAPPEGWRVEGSAEAALGTVTAGASVRTAFTLVPSTEAAGGTQTIRVSGEYRDSSAQLRSLQAAHQTEVVYRGLETAYNSVSVTTVAGKASGNFDGGGASFSAEQLAQASVPAGGVRPGSVVPVALPDGSQVSYTWPQSGPDRPNAVALAGQTIQVSGKGTHLAVLGSAASGKGINTELTLTYGDGTRQKQPIFYPNWLQPRDLGGAVLAVSSQGRNNANGPSPEYTQYKYQAFSSVVRLIPGKELISVTLPEAGKMKFFDWKVVTQKLPDAPEQDIYASDWPWVSASNGWGVIGRDAANKDREGAPDEPLAINFTDPQTGRNPVYGKGLGVHAASKITYYLGGQCSRFNADVGLRAGYGGQIIFSVAGDGRRLYQSRTFTPGFAPERIDVDLTGVQYFDLMVDPANAGNINGAHGIWGDAKFSCSSPDRTPPVTVAEVSPEPAETGWYRQVPTVVLRAQDDSAPGAAGRTTGDVQNAQLTEYRFLEADSDAGQSWYVYAEPLTIPEGIRTLEYRSTDAAGNVEKPQSQEFRVDSIAPEVSAVTVGRSVRVEAKDGGSGLARVEFSRDSGRTWNLYAEPVSANDEGLSLSYRAWDIAGNLKASTADVVIPPISTVTEPGGGGQPGVVDPGTTQPGTTQPGIPQPGPGVMPETGSNGSGASGGMEGLAYSGGQLPAVWVAVAVLLLLLGGLVVLVARSRRREAG